MNNLFPVFLKLEQLSTLIVGGGYVGLEKLTAVLTNSPEARVKLIAPEIREDIIILSAQYTNVFLIYKEFEETDLDDIDLVIAGTCLKDVNIRVRVAAKARKILSNIADTPDLCDFYLSSVVKKGDLKIAISTNGKSPTLAKRLREMFEEIIPEGTQDLLDNLKAVREKLRGDFEYKVNKLNEITTIFRNKKED